MHAVLISPYLSRELAAERAAAGLPDDDEGLPCATFLRALASDQIGRVDLSRARSATGVRKYLAKVASAIGGELAKAQGIIGARSHQRTFGASKGMLAPRFRRDTGWTGTMLRRDGSPVRWDKLTWQAEGLAIHVERGDVRAVAFWPEDPAHAFTILRAPNLDPPQLDRMPLRIVPQVVPTAPRSIAPRGARRVGFDVALAPRLVLLSPVVSPRGP